MVSGQSRRVQITIATLLMAAAIYAVGNNFLADRRTATPFPVRGVETPVLLREAGMFSETAGMQSAAEAETPPQSRRDLALFYSRRAYPGAPPAIPHPLLDKRGIGGKGCNGCHAKGGWMPVFNAYTPVTPHPQWLNCLSCHVPVTEKSQFKGNGFVPAARPQIRQAALPGGPPRVPHSLDYRSNCQACHAGPAAVKEIRTSHPNRQNCRQCHVSIDSNQVFSRP